TRPVKHFHSACSGSGRQTVPRHLLQRVELADLVEIQALVAQRLQQMQHVFHARQIHSLLTSQELNHANPSDIVFGVAPSVRSRSLWLDQILALVNHQGAGMEVEDLAGDAGGENRPPGGNRRHPLSFSHITPARSIPRPRIAVTLYSRYHLLLTGASL